MEAVLCLRNRNNRVATARLRVMAIRLLHASSCCSTTKTVPRNLAGSLSIIIGTFSAELYVLTYVYTVREYLALEERTIKAS